MSSEALDSPSVFHTKLVIGWVGLSLCAYFTVFVLKLIELNKTLKRKPRFGKDVGNDTALTVDFATPPNISKNHSSSSTATTKSSNSKNENDNISVVTKATTTLDTPGHSSEFEAHIHNLASKPPSPSFEDNERHDRLFQNDEDYDAPRFVRSKLRLEEKLVLYGMVMLLLFMTYLLLVFLPSGAVASLFGTLCMSCVIFKTQVGDEIRRKRYDRLSAILTLIIFAASFLSLITYASIGLREGTIYEGPARITGYDTSTYETNTGSGTKSDEDEIYATRMDLEVAWGGDWGCPDYNGVECKAFVSGALCETDRNLTRRTTKRQLSFWNKKTEDTDGDKTTTTTNTTDADNTETDNTNADDSESEEETVEEEEEEETVEEEEETVEEEEETVEEMEKEIEELKAENEKLKNQNSKLGHKVDVEGKDLVDAVDVAKEYYEEAKDEEKLVDYYKKEVLEEEKDVVIESGELMEEEVVAEYYADVSEEEEIVLDELGKSDEVEDIKDKELDYYDEVMDVVEEFVEEEEDVLDAEIDAMEDEEEKDKDGKENEVINELEEEAENIEEEEEIKEEIKEEKEDQTEISKYYDEVIDELEKEEEEVKEDILEEEKEGADDEVIEEEEEVESELEVEIIEEEEIKEEVESYNSYQYAFDDDVFEDDWWYSSWTNVWGEYACNDLFDADIEGKTYDSNTKPGADEWPYVNIYGSCNRCEAYLVDYYSTEHFNKIKQYETHAKNYALVGMVGLGITLFLAYRQYVSPGGVRDPENLYGQMV